MDKLSFNHGYCDGVNSVFMKNPIHNNWKKDKTNKVIHHNKDYLKGYKQGFRDTSKGFYPFCLQ